jgi:class 3 adenylate cyclase
MPMVETLETGRDAFERHAWQEAVDAFTAADREAGLAPEDLERLATSAWWSARPDDATDAYERAFASFTSAGRPLDAARVAMELGYRAFRVGNVPIAMGWQARTERILADLPESPTHARFAIYGVLMHLIQGDWAGGIKAADEAMAMARRQADPNTLYQVMSFKGIALIQSGDWRAGLPLIDESAAAIATGELDLRYASDIYCNTIAACRNVGDLTRAAQWCAEGERWMRANGAGGYPGICRVHRSEIKMLGGEWGEAEQLARQAAEELKRFRLLDGVGYAEGAIGEVRLRMGDLDGASEAFDRAYEYGHDPQPGLALLQLARGETAEARRTIDRALAVAKGTGGLQDRATRGRLLPALVEIALAARDFAAAREAVDELQTIAAEFDRPLFHAGAMTGRGELLLGEEKAAEASPLLGESWRLWQTMNLPYESARARLHYAEALAAEGDTATARRDLVAARSTFERLGATLDLQAIDKLLGEEAVGAASATARREGRVTRTFMFTDIVGSTDLVGSIGDEAWSEILRWHDRELRSALAAHGGVEIDHTGDGFFAAFERAGDAVDAAVDIQRRLARHRREHGFAPFIRIGLHTTEATRKGRNFSGHGVHLAARVGAAAGKDEVLVSKPVLEAAGAVRFALSEPRSVMLKGITDPVEVRAVEWR